MSETTFYIPLSKKALLQNIERNIESGYTRYIQGEIPTSKLQSLINKFADKFNIHFNQIQRNANKRKGIANCRLYCYPKEGNYADNPAVFEWLVIATDGTLPDEHQFKNLHDKKHKLKFQNLNWWWHYHTEKKKNVWTWFYTKQKYQLMRDYLEDCCKNQHTPKTITEINYFLSNLQIEAGFSGMNDQQFHLQMILKKGLAKAKQAQVNFFKPYRNKGYLKSTGTDVTISSLQIVERYNNHLKLGFVSCFENETRESA